MKACIWVILSLFSVAALGSQVQSALLSAIESGSVSAVTEAIKLGANLEESGQLGWKPIMVATQMKNADIVSILLEAGASPHAADILGESLLHIACGGPVDILKRLIKAGSDPNAENQGGITPLMLCASSGNLEAVRALVTAGARIDAKDHDGATVAQWAERGGHHLVVTFLLEAQSAPGRVSKPNGNTPGRTQD